MDATTLPRRDGTSQLEVGSTNMVAHAVASISPVVNDTYASVAEADRPSPVLRAWADHWARTFVTALRESDDARGWLQRHRGAMRRLADL
jgi:hypothetical protein